MSKVENTSHDFSGMTVLCVDDERIILRTLSRLFHKKTYKTITATSAKIALELLDEQDVDVIISDMRMPEMDGAALLSQVAISHPDTYRIVLSGYADFDSTVAAINLGKIHRFVNKPWDNDELVKTTEEGLKLTQLTRENQKLKEHIEQQNILLKKANSNLEEKVNKRTKQIKQSLLRNERDNKDCEKMLFNFIGIHPGLSGNYAKQVAHLSVKLGHEVLLDKDVLYDLRLSGYLVEVGLLGLKSYFCKTPYRSMTYDEKTTFMNQSQIVQQILSPAQRLNRVKEILKLQFLTLDEIDQQTDKDTAKACRVFIIARDFWRYSCGKIIEGKMDSKEVFLEMNKHRGNHYDEDFLDILISNPELINETKFDNGISTAQVLSGMILRQSLFSNHNLLILAEGHVFTENSIDKLIEYEENQHQNFVLYTE